VRDDARIMASAEVELKDFIMDEEPHEWHRLEHSVIFLRNLNAP
jgi:hypothetical protein